MKIIILNYCIGAVQIAELPNDLLSEEEDMEGLDQSERIEDYMQDELDINLSEITWMISDDECPVYPIGSDEPIATL